MLPSENITDMEIGDFVGWIQLGVWVIGGILYLGRVWREKSMKTTLVPKIFASNLILGLIIVAGIAASSAEWFLRFHQDRMHFDPKAKLEDVSDQSFTNQIVDVDGRSFHYCVFTNVKFRYDGRTKIVMEHNTFKGSIWLLTDNPSIAEVLIFAKGIGMMPDFPIVGPDGQMLPNIKSPIPIIESPHR